MDKLTQAFHFRHACKLFDETKKIPSDDLNYILEAGRTSPSSFGLEPWHFVVVKDDLLKAELKLACFNQEQVTSCSHLVIVLHRKAGQFTMQSEYLRQTEQRSLTSDATSYDLDVACQYFINYANFLLAQGTNLDHWSEMQGYIASANMLTAAAYQGIDSCTIGGFEPDKVIQILEKATPQFSRNNFGITLCLAFGYRKNPQPKQIRWSMDDITTFL
ncbi:NAD(P)H-dependent oxidoreductase [Frischella sp. Ac48]|uniref:NAD(P)H-dependent oxidoreductase n=1 Tax=Frischella japonica TaxID=2741544 RepID=A0ABR7QVQ1_9GAMM|nr:MULTISPECIES: NAD(P)H-dependent oxidoreductase [Frischella]MBC9130287.1 NAD(P)H-dependent oxidoreductase [Frischella japonica]MBX4133276.1 NAD(P)H-dependent oxidoreductase [Frischella sp. Ac48]